MILQRSNPDPIQSWKAEDLVRLEFFVPGAPRPQARPRHVKNKKTGNVFTYSPKDDSGWIESVTLFARKNNPKLGKFRKQPVTLTIYFYMPRPKALYNKSGIIPHIITPDLDNLEKAVMDALTTANIWDDDSQVCRKITEKRYVRLITTERIGARIIIEKWFPEW